MSVFKYYLNTQILMLVFKYLPRVFKYLTNHCVQRSSSEKNALSLNTVHILGLDDFAELSADQRDTCLQFIDSLLYVVEIHVSVSLSIYSI